MTHPCPWECCREFPLIAFLENQQEWVRCQTLPSFQVRITWHPDKGWDRLKMETPSPFWEDFTMHMGLCHSWKRVPDLLGEASMTCLHPSRMKFPIQPAVSMAGRWCPHGQLPVTSVQRFSSFGSCSYHQISPWKHRFLGGPIKLIDISIVQGPVEENHESKI